MRHLRKAVTKGMTGYTHVAQTCLSGILGTKGSCADPPNFSDIEKKKGISFGN